MRYRLSRVWVLDYGRLLAPSGTVIDSNSDDEWSRCAAGSLRHGTRRRSTTKLIS
jgi:hypothetical protein